MESPVSASVPSKYACPRRALTTWNRWEKCLEQITLEPEKKKKKKKHINQAHKGVYGTLVFLIICSWQQMEDSKFPSKCHGWPLQHKWFWPPSSSRRLAPRIEMLWPQPLSAVKGVATIRHSLRWIVPHLLVLHLLFYWKIPQHAVRLHECICQDTVCMACQNLALQHITTYECGLRDKTNKISWRNILMHNNRQGSCGNPFSYPHMFLLVKDKPGWYGFMRTIYVFPKASVPFEFLGSLPHWAPAKHFAISA